MLDKFRDYLEYEKRFSFHTITAYTKDIEQFMEFSKLNSSMELKTMSHLQIREWIVHLKNNQLTNKTVNRKLATLRSLYKWLRQEAYIKSNPMQKVKAPKIEKRLPIFAKETELSEDRIKVLFDDSFSGKRDKLIFELLYQTGIRLSELINLKEKNCHSDSIKVLGKRNKERVVPISDRLNNLVIEFKNLKKSMNFHHENLLILNNGNKLYPTFVYRKINHYLSLATNMDRKSPHVLRHTFATHMLNRGSGLETLKDLLGHANLSATQIYTHNSFAQLTSIYSQAHPRGQK